MSFPGVLNKAAVCAALPPETGRGYLEEEKGERGQLYRSRSTNVQSDTYNMYSKSMKGKVSFCFRYLLETVSGSQFQLTNKWYMIVFEMM